MKSTALLLLAGIAASSTAVSDSSILARSVPGAHVVSLDFQKEKCYNAQGHAGRRKIRRRTTVLATLDNEYLLYYVDVQVGTPPQSLRLQVDTGSSDVWAPSSNSKHCRSSDTPCNEGSYNPDSSSTSKIIERNGFSISYLDGTHSSGDFISEVFTIGNITIDDLQLGVGYDTDISAGILGIGFGSNSVSASSYPSLVDNLVAHKYINARAYSLYLNDQEANTGSILFGGIDTQKFEGKLIGLPIQRTPDTEDYTDFLVSLTSIGFSGQDGVEQSILNETLTAVLDSGSSLTYLPNSTVTNIVKRVGGIWSSDLESYMIPCSLTNDGHDYVHYRFGGHNGPVIRIPMEELTNYIIDINGDIWTDIDGNPACIFGIQPQPEGFGDSYLFGDTFLRSAYVVYDLDGKKIWMAQTVFNATASNILEIQNSTISKSGVPNASGIASVSEPLVVVTTVMKPMPTGYITSASETALEPSTTDNASPNSQSTGPARSGTDQSNSPNAGLRNQVGGAAMACFAVVAIIFSALL
ncbi:hypothetical protein H072_10334 [Dactylellina haptotyla CBS 200.50]|uniref:Peptidase A1 domain-containing protein n=1 Tax=Dactylellina haptotyla (strain CBS 200.50) TaxID=1284197 RepID=S8BAL4_DACHA|nr:hypothetical protein H072_10334 [Dactylellina haptotyla CBS 200.50]